MQEREKIRNFCIVAHIDHGKSTLADRILEITKAIEKEKMREQFLDSMELERERGITIKAKAVRLNFGDYILNLIDTPGHVDFSYEVAKSLKATEGAILLVDATQGVEAQTVANFYLALESNLRILPVINKIDLPQADIERTSSQLKEIFGFKEEEISLVSAKEGRGVRELLGRIIKEIPSPSGNFQGPLKAFVFDSTYDVYKGVILFVRIFDGKIRIGDEVVLLQSEKGYKVEELGVFTPQPVKKETLSSGEVGYLCCHIKYPQEVNIPDTITSCNSSVTPLLEYERMPPMVFCGIFPNFPKDYEALRQALEKLHLQDPSFSYEPDNLGSLGYGFRCGFLGLLHMEIIEERLEREFGLNLIITSPNVKYRVKTRDGKVIEVETPHRLPPLHSIEEMEEPFVKASILTPLESMESICELAKSRRGNFVKMDYLGKDRLNIIFELPLSEIIVDFYDKIKSITRGYGSLDYEFVGYKKTEIVKVDILFNRDIVEVFSFLTHKDKAYEKAKEAVLKLKKIIPRQMFEVNIQAAIGSKIIASERIPPLRKNVTAKCYGGDVTRKRKLWEKQKEGKKKLKQIGKISVPREAFLEILKMEK